MFIPKKIQWFSLISQYKQFCKSGRSRKSNILNQYHGYDFYNYTYRVECFLIRTKSKKLSRKRSKLKMASFSNDRSSRSNCCCSNNKNDSKPETVDCICDCVASTSRRTTCSYKRRYKSEGSIINSTSTENDQRINSRNYEPQNCDTNYGVFNFPPFISPIPIIYGHFWNPMHYQFYPNHHLYNNYNRSFMYRSDDSMSRSSRRNNTDTVRDRNLLSEWRGWRKTQYGKEFGKMNNCDKDGVSDLTVMSYNVLSQELLTNHSYLYKYHKQEALDWKTRWKNLLFEIRQNSADILCLQEVQTSHVETYFKELRTLGYDGIHKSRTGNTTVDGCAIYYKTATLKLIDSTTVEFNQPDVFILNRDNVAIIAKFASIQNPDSKFVVATTHLLFNRKREDVRLAQTQVLLSEVDRMSFVKSKTKSYHLPIIITGDFNFKPNTPVYNLITTGSLRYDNLLPRTLRYPNSNYTYSNLTGKFLLPSALGITDTCQHASLVEHRDTDKVIDELDHIYLYHSERQLANNNTKSFDKGLFSSGIISHHLALMSAYEHRRGQDLEATTWQDNWITVDYIFYSGLKNRNNLVVEDKLKLYARFALPIAQQLHDVTIPNMAVGSDHFSLIVKFKLYP